MGDHPAPERPPVPVRTILATIGLVLATAVAIYLLVTLAHIVLLLVVALFFAVVFTPPVDFVQRHLRLGRGLATTLVFLVFIAVMAALLYVFIRPLVAQSQHFVDRFPTYVEDAKDGRGPLGRLVQRYQLDDRLEDNRKRITDSLSRLGGGAFQAARSLASAIATLLTILILAILMIIYGPELLRGGVGILSPPTRQRVSLVANDCVRALTGYVFGNLLISVFAGTVTFLALWVFGVPFRSVLALWVAFADLIPLVGATLGAVPTVIVAFLHSTTAGIGMAIVFLVYQQFENHVLQVLIMSKTVQINQLFVLVSVLMGVELLGVAGALLAIPTAGVIHVVVRDLWDHRKGRPKSEPTIGEDRVPAGELLRHDDVAARQPLVRDLVDEADPSGGDFGAPEPEEVTGRSPGAEGDRRGTPGPLPEAPEPEPERAASGPAPPESRGR